MSSVVSVIHRFDFQPRIKWRDSLSILSGCPKHGEQITQRHGFVFQHSPFHFQFLLLQVCQFAVSQSRGSVQVTTNENDFRTLGT